MKRLLLAAVAVGVASVSGVGLAEEGHSHAHEAPKASVGTQTITGEVVDLACYLGHGEKGPGHKDCARKCITSGLPVGIKTADGLYLAIGSEHAPANAALASLAAQQVTVEGEVTERDGVHLIVIKKVTPKGA
jgi:hypothetical protein